MKAKHTKVRSAVLSFMAGVANHAHAALFGHMARSGLIAFDVDSEALQKELKRIGDAVKEEGEKALKEAEKAGTLSAETKKLVDDLMIKQNELRAEFADFLKKVTDNPSGADKREKSYGEQVIESDAYKNSPLAKGARGSFSLSLKTVTVANVGALIRPRYETDIVPLQRRRLTVRDLLNVIPIDTGSVDYPKMTTRTNNAAPVAEAAAKPYSDYVWANATATVRTIAHLAKLTRQALDDAPRLRGEVDSEMRYGLGLVEEAQLLNGDGTGQNLNGIVTQATAFSAPITITSPTRIDNLRLAMLQAEIALYPVDGIVLHPGDWAGIELTKTTDGAYLFANPQGNAQPRMWGLPVVPTPAMTIDKFLVGNFEMGATIYDRMGVEVLISTENVDDFEKNLATMRAEERIALAVKRPGAFIYGDFGVVT